MTNLTPTMPASTTNATVEALDDERLQDLVENANDLVQSVAMDGRFVYVNRRWRELLGYDAEELRTLRLADVIRADHLDACKRMFEDLRAGHELPTVETVFVARDGRAVEVEGRVSLRRDCEGRATATRGIFRDVTEQRAARRRIEELLGMTRAIVDNAPVGIALYAPDGTCIDANEALARTLGATRELVLAQNFRRVVSWRRRGLLELAEKCLTEGEPTETEVWIDTTFGAHVCLRCRFAPASLSGERHLVLLADDVTEDRRREDALVATQRRLREVHAIASHLAGQTDLDTVLQTAIDRTRMLVRADFGAIVRLDPETGRPREAHPSNYPMERIPPGTQVVGRGLLAQVAHGDVVHSARVDGEPNFEGWPAWHPRVGAMLGLPARDRERVLALLLLGREPGAEPFNEEEREIAGTIADLAAMALRVAQQFSELQTLNARLSELATTDTLMQVGNRRAFDDALRILHARSTRYAVPYGLLLADIDHFKRYNDRYGHPAGDRALAAAAGLLKSAIRTVDGVFRYGGEEIVLLLPHQSRNGTLAAAERLRRRVEEAAIAHPDNGPGVLTLSFGCAVYDPEEAPRCEREARAVLQAADEALYRAKQLGRNRVELAPPVGTAAVALPGISE